MSETQIMRAVAVPLVPVGEIKSFGPFGPKYEVGPVLRPPPRYVYWPMATGWPGD